MWIPASAEQIEEAALGGRLTETPGFDAKAELPSPKKNVDIAKDVAAMATDGGVLLFGVAEDEHGEPTRPTPIALAGSADRVSQIVSTSIKEVPFVDIRTYPCTADPAVGYLVVAVPQSSRAPHMVVVGGDNRFYGRDAKGNRMLGEGDVARLYERRQRWAVDRDEVLHKAIEGAPVGPLPGRAYVHAFARPVAVDHGVFERAEEAFGGRANVHQHLLSVVHSTELRGKYGPSLESAAYWGRHGADVWRFSNCGGNEVEAFNADPDPDRDPTDIVAVEMAFGGKGTLFCGRGSDTLMSEPGRPLVIEVVIAGNVEAFFTLMGAIYTASGYYGAVDVGVAVTGVAGAFSERRRRSWDPGQRYPVNEFRRTDRVAAAEVEQAAVLSQRLLRHFFEATSGIDGYDPWTTPSDR